MSASTPDSVTRGPDATERPQLDRRVIAVAVLAAFVAFLDGSIVNVALPAITDELGGGLPLQQWVVDAYLLTLGSVILLAGSLSDRYGRLPVLRVGLIAFGITSIACGLAPTAELLVAARAAQGLAAALLVPSSLALIMSTHSGAAQARAIGLWTALTSASFIVGPLLGGVLTDLFSWRWIFGINVVPIALTIVLMLPLRESRPERSGPIDVLGALLGALGLGGVVFALIEQANFGWTDPLVLGALVLGALLLVAFLVRQSRARHPMLPLSMFRVRNVAWGNLATAAIYGALGIASFALVVFLQQVAGLSATLAGVTMLPVTLMLIALSSTAGSLAGRFGSRWFMTVGPLVVALGFVLLMSIEREVDVLSQVLPGVLLFGLGMAITVAPLTSAVLGAVEPARSGIASAVNNAVSRVAGLIGVALLGTVAGTQVDETWLDRALLLCVGLMVVGALFSAVGIRDRRPLA